MKTKNFKAQLGPGSIIPFTIVLVVAIVLITVGAYITAQIGNTLTTGTNTVGSSGLANVNSIANNGANALTTMSTWFTILAIVFIAAVVIGLLLYAFGGRKGGAY